MTGSLTHPAQYNDIVIHVENTDFEISCAFDVWYKDVAILMHSWYHYYHLILIDHLTSMLLH